MNPPEMDMREAVSIPNHLPQEEAGRDNQAGIGGHFDGSC